VSPLKAPLFENGLTFRVYYILLIYTTTAVRTIPTACEFRQSKYLNNLIEQDHRFIKRLVKPGMGFFSFETAEKTLQEYGVMNMIRKVRVQGGGEQRRQPEPSSVHRRTVRSGHLNIVEEQRSSVLGGPFRVFAT
jgi:hypothetical protein